MIISIIVIVIACIVMSTLSVFTGKKVFSILGAIIPFIALIMLGIFYMNNNSYEVKYHKVVNNASYLLDKSTSNMGDYKSCLSSSYDIPSCSEDNYKALRLYVQNFLVSVTETF